MLNMSLPFLQLSLLKRSFKCHAQGKGAFGFSEINIFLLFWHKSLIPNFKCYCHEGLCMSQHTGSHKNSLNSLGEKYLNESHWPMCRIRLLECTSWHRSYRTFYIVYIYGLSLMCWRSWRTFLLEPYLCHLSECPLYGVETVCIDRYAFY